jgi:hypothetical protein
MLETSTAGQDLIIDRHTLSLHLVEHLAGQIGQLCPPDSEAA